MSSASLLKLCGALALTASISMADKLSLAELMNLQTEMVDHLDMGHAELDDSEHEENELNELEWDTISEKSGNLKCKEGQIKVGCCKCVSDTHVAAKHLTIPEIKSMPLAYHGMEPSATAVAAYHGMVPSATAVEQPIVMPTSPRDMIKSNEPNLAGWFKFDSSDKPPKEVMKEAMEEPEKTKQSGKDYKKKDSKKQKDDDDKNRKVEDYKSASSKRQRDSEQSKDLKKDSKRGEDDQKSASKTHHPIYDADQDDRTLKSQKQKFTMSTTEEQARGTSTRKTYSKDQQIKTEEFTTSMHQSGKETVKEQDDDKKKSEKEDEDKQAAKCPEGFTFESHKRQDQAPWVVEACRMPMSYDLENGKDADHRGLHSHQSHHDGHYSYGRWLETCAENFVRNGCCTCTPHCPEGMVMHEWTSDSHDKSDFVCLIFAGDNY